MRTCWEFTGLWNELSRSDMSFWCSVLTFSIYGISLHNESRCPTAHLHTSLDKSIEMKRTGFRIELGNATPAHGNGSHRNRTIRAVYGPSQMVKFHLIPPWSYSWFPVVFMRCWHKLVLCNVERVHPQQFIRQQNQNTCHGFQSLHNWWIT